MRSSVIYFFGALGGLLFGYSTGIISGALHYLGQDLEITENSFTEGFITASLLVGAAIGAFIIGKLADAIGRKNSLLVAAVLFVFGSLFTAISGTPVIFVVARVVLGIAVGAVSALVPLYLSELSPTARRGSIAFINQLMIVVGILIAYLVNYFLSEFGSENWNTDFGWRYAFGAGAAPALILLLGVLILPESPRFLVLSGNDKKARRVLSDILPASQVDSVLEDIKKAVSARTGRLSDLFSRFARPALIIAIGLAFFQQFAGINTLIYYAPKVFEVVGLDESQQRLGTVCIGLVNVISTILAITIVDRINRRTLLTLGGVVMAVSLFGLATIESTQFIHSEPMAAGIYSVLAMSIYMFAFGLTWGGVMWIVLAEIFPLHIRGVGVGLSSAVNWVANFTIILLFPWLLGHQANEPDCFSECDKVTMLGGSPFWLYIGMAVFTIFGVIFVRVKLFETRGKSLEEIESELDMRALSISDK